MCTIDGAVNKDVVLSSACTFAAANEPIRLRHYEQPPVHDDHVLISMIASSVNPLDRHVLAGTYPLKPRFNVDGEVVAGEDGVARVMKVGRQVLTLRIDDLVVPRKQGIGTWRTHALVRESDLRKIPECADAVFAAVLRMTVLPAYFLLEEAAALASEDWIMLNAGTSMVSQFVAQFARLRGYKIMVVYRPRSSEQEDARIRHQLEGMGADLALNENQLSDDQLFQGKRIAIAFDAVWGSSAEKLLSRISNDGLLLNYGRLSGGNGASPLNVPHASVFVKGITVKSFRLSTRLAKRSDTELQSLINQLISLSNNGSLRTPAYSPIDLEDESALADAISSSDRVARNGKPIIMFGRNN